MNERLIVKNFLCLKDVDIEVKDFLILIGPQAAGKSLCAKLLYFFRSIISDIDVHIFATGEKKLIDFEQNAVEKFELFFDKTQWATSAFEVNFIFNHEIHLKDKETNILISKKKNKSIKIVFDKNLIDNYKYIVQVLKERENGSLTNDELLAYLQGRTYVDNAKLISTYLEEIFIPAGRSFFQLLENNIFAFLSVSKNIDSIMKNFGVFLESIKSKKNNIPKEIVPLLKAILKGEYIPEEGVLLQPDGRKISPAICSSGQQESLPLAIILSYIASTPLEFKRSNLYVEEPEAHLFPDAQEAISRLISFVWQNSRANLSPDLRKIFELPRLEVSFVITTHSPFILAAFNNLIKAGNIVKQNPALKEAVCKEIPESMHIDIERFAAYSLEDGRAVSIIDKETNLIGTDAIDEVSEDIMEIFSSLLDIEYNGKDAHGGSEC